MSSSNLIEVAIIPETTYGETPSVGDFETARFTSESLSGTPDTTESQQIRTDRMSSGQVVTGLTVGGELQMEIAKDDVLDMILQSAMQSDWVVSSAVTVDLDLDASAKTLTRDAGDFNADSRVGDTITLTGFTNTVNNVQVTIAEITSATVVKIVGPTTLVTEAGSGTSFEVADYLEIGLDKKSFSMQKRFLDLTDKAINYRGMMVSDFNIDVNYGEIVKGSASFSGNDYEPVDATADFMTDGRTVNSAATTQSLNGSVDMPFVATRTTGILGGSTFCMQNIGLKLNNNLNTRNCIGKAAPQDYSLGTAQIEVSLSSYLADSNWSMLAKKLTQETIAISFQIKNADGWYAFYLPAIQLSFDDPASAGQNQETSLGMSGQTKVGESGESSLRIFRS